MEKKMDDLISKYNSFEEEDEVPLPELLLPLKVEAKYSADEMKIIQDGYFASCMEEKWNITYEEGRLLFRRSWSGICEYLVEFSEKEGGFYISSAEVNNNPDEYVPMGDGFEEASILFLIDALLLGKEVELRSEFPDGVDGLTLWSCFGRTLGQA